MPEGWAAEGGCSDPCILGRTRAGSNHVAARPPRSLPPARASTVCCQTTPRALASSLLLSALRGMFKRTRQRIGLIAACASVGQAPLAAPLFPIRQPVQSWRRRCLCTAGHLHACTSGVATTRRRRCLPSAHDRHLLHAGQLHAMPLAQLLHPRRLSVRRRLLGGCTSAMVRARNSS